MKVLVTGANGFIGSHVCRELLARGHEVSAVVRPGAKPHKLPPNSELLHLAEWDVFQASESDLLSNCDGFDSCIHCAWYVVPGQYLTATQNEGCRLGSLRLISALLSQGCRHITGVGTCFEYLQRDGPLDETAPIQPLTPYASAKLATFIESGALVEASNASLAWARLFYLYGPWEDPRRLVPDVTLRLLRGERAATTSGLQTRDFLHVEDVAAALIDVSLAGVRGPVNIGSGIPVRVRELVQVIGEITKRADLIDIGARAENAVDPPYVCANNHRLRELSGWQPRYDLRSGLEQTISWWKDRS